MKIIALLCFKNEAKHLPALCCSMEGVIDELIAIDDFSTDEGPEFLKNFKGFPISLIRPEVEKKGPVEKTRKQLFKLGRFAGGTHFVILDADEAFTAPFTRHGRKIISKMQPGQKIQLQWLAMWKSIDHYRDDNSVWSNNFKDFVVCDDQKIEVDDGFIHKGRTPGPNTEENTLKLNPKYGAVFHWQFADWKTFNMKQAWYRCIELLNGRNAGAVNQVYSITRDDPNATVRAVPQEWIQNKMPKLSYNEPLSWHYYEIAEMFKKHGIEKFKNLDIWHIRELKDLKNS
jgi:hypothetical protein